MQILTPFILFTAYAYAGSAAKSAGTSIGSGAKSADKLSKIDVGTLATGLTGFAGAATIVGGSVAIDQAVKNVRLEERLDFQQQLAAMDQNQRQALFDQQQQELESQGLLNQQLVGQLQPGNE